MIFVTIDKLYEVMDTSEAGKAKVLLMVRLIESGNASEMEVEKARQEIAEALLA